MNQAKPINKPISLILPIYNEAENIKSIVSSALDFLSDKINIFEIILVNDGSTDRTPVIIDRLSGDNKQVRVVHHLTNKGYGAALVSGFHLARYERVAFMDSDGQFDISEIEKFLLYDGEYDIVAGYRVKRRDPFHRVILGAAYTRLISLLFGVSLKDINCGFKVINKSILDKIEIFSAGALVDAEILVKAKQMGCSVKEVGVTHFSRKRGKQTGARFKVILKALRELGGLFAEMRLGIKR